jgi:hypothetical protein
VHRYELVVGDADALEGLVMLTACPFRLRR